MWIRINNPNSRHVGSIAKVLSITYEESRGSSRRVYVQVYKEGPDGRMQEFKTGITRGWTRLTSEEIAAIEIKLVETKTEELKKGTWVRIQDTEVSNALLLITEVDKEADIRKGNLYLEDDDNGGIRIESHTFNQSAQVTCLSAEEVADVKKWIKMHRARDAKKRKLVDSNSRDDPEPTSALIDGDWIRLYDADTPAIDKRVARVTSAAARQAEVLILDDDAYIRRLSNVTIPKEYTRLTAEEISGIEKRLMSHRVVDDNKSDGHVDKKAKTIQELADNEDYVVDLRKGDWIRITDESFVKYFKHVARVLRVSSHDKLQFIYCHAYIEEPDGKIKAKFFTFAADRGWEKLSDTDVANVEAWIASKEK